MDSLAKKTDTDAVTSQSANVFKVETGNKASVEITRQVTPGHELPVYSPQEFRRRRILFAPKKQSPGIQSQKAFPPTSCCEELIAV